MNNQKTNDIPGWFDYAEIYDRAIKTAKNNSIFVEIGAWFGKSTSYMANAIKKSGKDIEFYVVDTWAGSEESVTQKNITKQYNNNIFHVFWGNMQKLHVDQHIKPIQINSQNAAKAFKDTSLDFAFIDASHVYESVMGDLKAWYPKIKHGGIIAGHDYDKRFEVPRAVNDFFRGKFDIIAPSSGKLTDSWLHVKAEMKND